MLIRSKSSPLFQPADKAHLQNGSNICHSLHTRMPLAP
nr:MAG TPA: hypothetical protein [Caudoviricetes sp.]